MLGNWIRPLPDFEIAPPTASTTFSSRTFAGAEGAWTRLSLVSIVEAIVIFGFVVPAVLAGSQARSHPDLVTGDVHD